jgi:effector-binding domain-containing protein
MSDYDVVIKQIEPLKVAAVRGVVPTPPEQGTLWIELEEYLETQPVRLIQPCLTLYHDDEYKERDWDLEVCQPIDGLVKETGRVKVRTLPAVPAMACVLHHGPLTRIGEAYDAICKWMDANGYRVCGQAREISVQIPMNPERGAVLADQSDPEAIMEVQFPVEKVK